MGLFTPVKGYYHNLKCPLMSVNNAKYMQPRREYLSRPDRRLLCLFLFLVWSGCDMWVGILCCMSRCCVSMFWPGMVPNQRQLVILVSD
jgi:hypothetical protein